MPKLARVIFIVAGLGALSLVPGCGSNKQTVCNLPVASSSSSSSLCSCACPVEFSPYLYAAGNNGEIASFPIDEPGGALGAPATTAGPTTSVGIAQFNNQFLYASDPQLLGESAIDMWSIDNGTGALTPVAGSPFMLGPSSVPAGLALADNVGPQPNGPGVYLYVADAGQIDALQVNTSTGALTAVPGSPFTSGTNSYVTVDGTDHFVYAADEDAPGGILAFTIDTSTGALTAVPGSPFLIGSNANPVSVGQIVAGFVDGYLYATLPATGQVAGFYADSNGVLTAVPGSPFAAGSGATAILMVNAPGSNAVVYVANETAGSISGFSIDASGALIPLASSPYAAAGVTALVPDPFYHLYAYGGSGITVFNILSSGELTPVGSPLAFSGATVLTYVGPNGLVP